MSRFVSDHLPASLQDALSADRARDNANRAIVICSIDEHGWPHPAMLSTFEVVAIDARNIRLATHVDSRTTRNLRANGQITLIFVDRGSAHYVKGDALLVSPALRSAQRLAMFNVRVDSVLADDPQAYEDARITTGITVERGSVDESAVAAILVELKS